MSVSFSVFFLCFFNGVFRFPFLHTYIRCPSVFLEGHIRVCVLNEFFSFSVLLLCFFNGAFRFSFLYTLFFSSTRPGKR